MALADWLLLVAGLLGLAVLLGLLARHLRLPLSVVLAVMGFLAGWLGGPHGVASPLAGEQFEQAVAFLFLPILIFEAALGLSVRGFFRNLPAIVVLAVPTLLVGAGLVGGALHLVLGLPLLAALVFGVLISATDPVAAVAVFRKLGVPERLLTLIEGESLLNDGVAIVLYNVLLLAALGGQLDAGEAVLGFLRVFFGGLLLGTLLGLLGVLLLPWLEETGAVTLSLATAYGGFVAAEHLAGLSGVTAALATGLTLNAFLPSRAAPEMRQVLNTLWHSLAYVANALLFLLLGLAIKAELLLEHWPVILLAVAVVLAARPVAVLLTVIPVQRIARLPRLGARYQAVLTWGGLRGGVALALALAIPERLPERELLVALTGGVVLTSLLLNATTVGALAHRLGLDKPSRSQRFLAAGARLSGVAAARQRLAELDLEEPDVEQALSEAEDRSRQELARLELDSDEEAQVVARRALYVERDTYQKLADAGMLPPPVARALLHEVDDHIEQACLSHWSLSERQRHISRFDRVLERLIAWMPPPLGADPSELAYAEASARRLAARRTCEALEMLQTLPQVDPEAVASARAVFTEWEQRAEQELATLDAAPLADRRTVYRRQAEVLGRLAARDELARLAQVGLIPPVLAEQAAAGLGARLEES